MHIAIIFYSFSGNTKKASEFLRDKILQKSHEVDLIELKLKQEETLFLRQCNAARAHQTPELANAECDATKYDLVVVASPVWAFTFAPALRTCLKNISGLENKKAAAFLTCGAAFTSGKALKELEKSLREKMADVKFCAYIAGAKTGNPEYLKSAFKDLFLLV